MPELCFNLGFRGKLARRKKCTRRKGTSVALWKDFVKNLFLFKLGTQDCQVQVYMYYIAN